MAEIDEGGHSVLAPSAAERWLQCPASIRMERALDLPPDSGGSVYAQEGTAAHALAEIQARFVLLNGMTKEEHETALVEWRVEHAHVITDEREMFKHALGYVDLLREKLAEHPNSVLLLEQRVPTGVPSCWGTSDAVIVSPVHVEIVDLKYGMGVMVGAYENPQLRLYGIGALEAFGDLLGDAEYVRMTVFQPRLDHIVSEQLTSAELRAWRDSIIPIAEVALGHDAPFGPSDDACRWCPASGQCQAQLAWATALDFGTDPELISPEELADALERIPMIEAWCAAVKDYALDLIYSKGTAVPRYKVVMSGGKRAITDPEGAIRALSNAGYAFNKVGVKKLMGIGDLEKLLGPAKFTRLVDPYITKGTGSPSLVPESDKRQAINPDGQAAVDFAAEEDLI